MALGAIAVAGLLWAVSYGANHQRLEQLRELASAQVQPVNEPDEELAVLAVLENGLQARRVFPDDGDVGVHERIGLYQGDASNPVLERAYERQLAGRLLPQAARILEAQIRASFQDRERLFPGPTCKSLASTHNRVISVISWFRVRRRWLICSVTIGCWARVANSAPWTCGG